MNWLGLIILILLLVIGYLLYKGEYFSTDTQSNTQSNESQPENISKTEITQSNNKDTLGVYYTEWCGYSRHFISDYNTMENDIKKIVNVDLVDCDKEPEKCRKNKVQGFPTLILHKKDKDVAYTGNRSREDLLNFLKNNA
jgi:thioredoxin-like negative regulator of GroEL